MSSLIAKNIKRKDKDYNKVVSLMNKAFPPKELVPMSLLRLLALRKSVLFLSFYDQNTFVGLSYIVDYKDSSFIFYLAVEEGERGKGYGSKILDWIKENKKDKNIILDVEALDKTKNNYQERVKRVEFYKRNGIIDTGYRLYDLGIKYMILASNPKTFEANDLVQCWRRYAFGLYTNKPFKEECKK